MKIIELPFVCGQIFKFHDNFYQMVEQEGGCSKCDLRGGEDDCLGFDVRCNVTKNIIFRKVEDFDKKDIIDVPFKNETILKSNDKYYTFVKIKETLTSCTQCSFNNSSIKCPNYFFTCSGFVFKELSEYEKIFSGII